MVVESVSACFLELSFLSQTDFFGKAIAFVLHDGRFSKWSHFSNIWCFFEGFFAQNNSNVLVE